MLFSVVDIVKKSAVISATSITGDCGTGPAKGECLTAVALKSEVRLVPMVDPAKGDFDGVVVRFDPFDNAGHFHSSLSVVQRAPPEWVQRQPRFYCYYMPPYAYRLPGSTQRVDPRVNPLQRNIAKKRPPSARQVRATFLFSVPPVRPYPQLSFKESARKASVGPPLVSAGLRCGDLARRGLAPLGLGSFLDCRVVLLHHLLVTVDLLREAPALETLGRELFLRRDSGEIDTPIVGAQLLERYDRLVRTHGLVFSLLSGDPDHGLTPTVLIAVASYLIQDV